MTLADIVSNELHRKQRSQRWLARQIGVSPMTVNNMVKGQRPDLNTVRKLSQFLGEPIGLLLKAAGFAPAIDDTPTDPHVLTTADDWATVKTVCIMRSLSPDARSRLLQVIQLFTQTSLAQTPAPGGIAAQHELPQRQRLALDVAATATAATRTANRPLAARMT